MEVVVCWCVGDVERGGGALAGSGLGAVLLLIWEFLQWYDRAGPDYSLARWPLQQEKASRLGWERVAVYVRQRQRCIIAVAL